jgi:hypothetical protein
MNYEIRNIEVNETYCKEVKLPYRKENFKYNKIII